MANTKHEDAIMKMGFGYFRDSILKRLGIDYEFVSDEPTELIELQIHSMYMDFTFMTINGFYVHFEFQTTETDRADLQRFEAYEAVTAHKTGKKVLTYVIYSGEITHAKTELDCGLHTYKVEPIYLMDYDADKMFQKLKSKVEREEILAEEDFAGLALAPLMSGKKSRKEKIKEAILFAKQEDTVTAEKTIAILYTLADKFLKGIDLQEIREVVSMTRLGQMIYDDGMEKGMDRMAVLTTRLLNENRLDDLKKAAADKKYCEQLLKEYGIE
ncbi:MAG: hypothetical protein ACI4EI_13485 [Muricoprocola sp.]